MKIDTPSLSQAVANHLSKFKSLQYNDKCDWDQHLTESLSIIDKLDAQDQVVSDRENNTENLRTLPQSFYALAKLYCIGNETFENHYSSLDKR